MGYAFHKSGVQKNGIVYYRCSQNRVTHCKTTLNVDRNDKIRLNNVAHNHPPKQKKTTSLAGE